MTLHLFWPEFYFILFLLNSLGIMLWNDDININNLIIQIEMIVIQLDKFFEFVQFYFKSYTQMLVLNIISRKNSVDISKVIYILYNDELLLIIFNSTCKIITLLCTYISISLRTCHWYMAKKKTVLKIRFLCFVSGLELSLQWTHV